MPQPGHHVTPINFKGHNVYCEAADGFVAANATIAAIQKRSSKLFFKNLINFI